MTRIYAIYVFRQTTSPFCLKTFTLGGILALGLFWFSWDMVFQNIFATVDGFVPLLNYSWSAFLNTELPVQVIVVLSSGFIFWLVWDVLPVGKMVVYKPLRFFYRKAL